MWRPGDIVSWRGIYNNHIWHVQPTIVVEDTPEEIALTLLPGTECVAPEGYLQGKQNGKRRWDFKDKSWKLEKYFWRTNRLLLLLEPQNYYATIYFWQADSNEFLCYYINFQIPFRRNYRGVDTLDLELDLIIYPDFSWEWKDLDDYQKGIDCGIILQEWAKEINAAKNEIFGKIARREYPLDGSWLNWQPDPSWRPPKLPVGWEQV